MVGNDLVKGIEVDYGNITAHFGPMIKSDLYTFEIIYPDLCMDVYYHHYNGSGYIPADIGNHPPVQIVEKDSYYYLVFDVGARTNDGCPDANTLIFKLSCPYIFGDDAVHEFVTYWKEDNAPTNSRLCYRIELDGTESIEEIAYELHNQISRATVILGERYTQGQRN